MFILQHLKKARSRKLAINSKVQLRPYPRLLFSFHLYIYINVRRSPLINMTLVSCCCCCFQFLRRCHSKYEYLRQLSCVFERKEKQKEKPFSDLITLFLWNRQSVYTLCKEKKKKKKKKGNPYNIQCLKERKKIRSTREL